MLDRNIVEIKQSKLLSAIRQLKNNRYRLVTMTAVDLGDQLELIYHFDRDFKTTNLRVQVDKNKPIHSISGIYFCAFLIENEIQDHFGVKFKKLAIDFGGHLLLDQRSDIKAPFCSVTIKQENGGKD